MCRSTKVKVEVSHYDCFDVIKHKINGSGCTGVEVVLNVSLRKFIFLLHSRLAQNPISLFHFLRCAELPAKPRKVKYIPKCPIRHWHGQSSHRNMDTAWTANILSSIILL